MRKRFYIIPSLAIILFLLSACESGGKLKVYNRCSYPAYIKVEGYEQKTLGADEEIVYNIDTKTQNIFTGTVKKDLLVWLIGETYSIHDEDLNAYIDSAWVKIEAGETYKIFLLPNRASVKIINASEQTISRAEIWQHSDLTHLQVGVLTNIMPGENKFLRVDYGRNYYYQVELYLPDGTHQTFGSHNTILDKDQQFLVTYTSEKN
ncbi:MAG: hypothetical protein ABFC98_01215 [Candidatus Cloacimonas sp.]